MSEAAATKDALLGGRVVFYQPARGAGYRTNVDSLLLARSASGGSRAQSTTRRAYDLGAGSGAVGLVVAALGGATELVLVEKESAACRFAARNLEANAVRGRVVHASVEALPSEHGGKADLVVCNPPFFLPGRGQPALPARRDARAGEVRAFLTCAATVLGRRGRACFVYPAADVARFLRSLTDAGFAAKRAVFVHARADKPARIVLVEAQLAKPGGLVVEPPWFDDDETIARFVRGSW